MPYFYLQEIPQEGTVSLAKEEAIHLTKTLRAKVGDKIQLINGKGILAEAEITDLSKRNSVSCSINSIIEVPQPSRKIHLFLAPPRNNIMSPLIKQCVELGVWSINLIECEFAVSKPKDKNNAYSKEIINGAKQSGNPFFPKIHSLSPFIKALDKCQHPKFYGAVPEEKVPSSSTELPNEVSLWIGPEGGFSPTELSLLQKQGQGLTIGNWVLRVETACTGLISILNHL